MCNLLYVGKEHTHEYFWSWQMKCSVCGVEIGYNVDKEGSSTICPACLTKKQNDSLKKFFSELFGEEEKDEATGKEDEEQKS